MIFRNVAVENRLVAAARSAALRAAAALPGFAGPADARKLVRLSHALFAVGGRDPRGEIKLAEDVKERAPFEIDASALDAHLPGLRVPSESHPCLALARPDQHVVRIIRPGAGVERPVGPILFGGGPSAATATKNRTRLY